MIGDYTSFTDMIDGGGPGQSGPQFEGGGILSAVANAVARPVGSRERGEPDMRTGLGGFARDMFDGGGFGQSGPTFQGGLLSGLFNAAGVRPMGYMERLGSVRPQMRPRPPAPRAVSAPPPPPAAMVPPTAQQVVTPPVYTYPLNDPLVDVYGRVHALGMPQQTVSPQPQIYNALGFR